MSNFGSFVKAAFDYTLTAVGTVCISPLLLYVAYRIKKEDPGPIFFAHTRIGKNGKPFPCYKFRSMVVNSQEMLQKYLAENPAAREEWEREWKLANNVLPLPCDQRYSVKDLEYMVKLLTFIVKIK